MASASADPSSLSMPPPAALPSSNIINNSTASHSLLSSQNHTNTTTTTTIGTLLRSPRQSPYRTPQSHHHHNTTTQTSRERSNSHSSYLSSPRLPLTHSPPPRILLSSTGTGLPTPSSLSSPLSPSLPPSLSSIPCIPNLNNQTIISHDHSVDAAVGNERARAKELERLEITMTADELRLSLKRERAHSSRLAADLAALKSASVRSQAEAEAHEEGRINHLLHRLECLQREKGRIIVELEREEEMLTNTLQKKLNEVRREKALLEQQIEREHNCNIDLKSQLSDLAVSREAVGGRTS